MEKNLRNYVILLLFLFLLSSLTAVYALSSTKLCTRYSIVKYRVKQVYVIKYYGKEPLNISDLELNIFSIPINYTQKVSYKVYMNGSEVKVIEKTINDTLCVEAPSIVFREKSNINYTLIFTIDVVNAEHRYPDQGILGKYLGKNINLTEPTSLWNYTHPTIRKVIDEEKFRSLNEIVMWIYRLKREGLLKYKTHIPPLYPWEVLEKGEGDCDEQANLLITVARGAKIPAFLQYGIVYIENYTRTVSVNDIYRYELVNTGWHGWVVAYDENLKSWVPIDLTFHVRSSRLPEYYGGVVTLNRTIIWGNIVSGDYIKEFNDFIKKLKKHNITIEEYDETFKVGSWSYSESLCLSDFVPAFLSLHVASISYVVFEIRKYGIRF